MTAAAAAAATVAAVATGEVGSDDSSDERDVASVAASRANVLASSSREGATACRVTSLSTDVNVAGGGTDADG